LVVVRVEGTNYLGDPQAIPASKHGKGRKGSTRRADFLNSEPVLRRVLNDPFHTRCGPSTGPRLPLTVEQPSSGIPPAWTKISLHTGTSVQAAPGSGNLSIEWLATYLEQRLTQDVWRAALLGTLTGAAIVIAWIEVVHRASL